MVSVEDQEQIIFQSLSSAFECRKEELEKDDLLTLVQVSLNNYNNYEIFAPKIRLKPNIAVAVQLLDILTSSRD